MKIRFNKFLGFTLAEVLITIGIIGVVAAITIPNLIAEHQKRSTVTKLQRAISVINQAYKLSLGDVGDISPDEVVNKGAENYFKEYWQPYIKVLNYCSSYDVCGYKSINPFKTPAGTSHGMTILSTMRSPFYTLDGFFYMIFVLAASDNGTVLSSMILVDINGSQLPNKFGKDVFILNREEDAGVVPYGRKLSDEEVNNKCSLDKSVVNNGYACAEKIRRAGWKIEKDYPW